MGVLSSLFFERRDHPSNVSERILAAFGAGWDTHTGAEVTPETSLQVAAVFACVRVLAESTAALPLLLYRRLERGKERAGQHSLYPLLHDAPNGEMTAMEFRETLTAHVALRGNAYAEIELTNGGEVAALWPLRPDKMTPRRKDGRVVYDYVLPTGKTETLPAWRVLHLRGLGFDGLVGYSPIFLMKQAVGLAMGAEEFGARLFGNGTKPGSVLKHPGKLSTEAHGRLKASVEEGHQGLSKAHRLMILEEGMDIASIGIAAEEAQFIESRKFQSVEIARMFRVPPHMIADLERATFCLPADTEVFTGGGPKRIADISAGETVWSWNGTEHVPARVLRAACTGNDEILELRTTNRTLRANAKHRILVRRKVVNPLPGPGGYQSIEWHTEYVPAGELRVGDTLIVLDSLPEGTLTDVEGRILTTGFMEFCGLLLGDGNVNHARGVTIARADAALYMDHYRTVMRDEFVSFGRKGNGRKRAGVAMQPVALSEGERQTRFSSVLAAEELTRLGLSGTARTKSVPQWVFQTSHEMTLAFLRGFLDADGSVDKKGRIAYHSVNRRMLSQIRHLCMSVGVPVTNLRRQVIKTTLPNGERFDGEIYTFTCSDPGANRRIGSYDPRYQMRLQNGTPFRRKGRAYPRHGGRDFDADGCSLSRIAEIRRLPAEPVYDLEVENTHSFIADGVIVHNSNIEHQDLAFAKHSLRPWLVRWEQRISQSLLTETERRTYFAEHLIDGLLRGDILSRYQAYNQGIQSGFLTRNEVRERENLNPLTGLDAPLTPLNMAEGGDGGRRTADGGRGTADGGRGTADGGRRMADGGRGTADGGRGAADGGTHPTPALPAAGRGLIEGRGRVERRSAEDVAAGRQRLMQGQQPLLTDAAGRVVRREVADIRRAVQKYLVKARDMAGFLLWLSEFYEEHREFVGRQMGPVLEALGKLVLASVGDELGEALGDDEADFVGEYVETLSLRWSLANRGELESLARDTGGGLDEVAAAIDGRLDGWADTEAEKTGRREAVRAIGAFSLMSYRASPSVTYIVWVASGENCPYCDSLNGTRVGKHVKFVAGGTELHPEGADGPMLVRSDTYHPPAHDGCNCVVLAG